MLAFQDRTQFNEVIVERAAGALVFCLQPRAVVTMAEPPGPVCRVNRDVLMFAGNANVFADICRQLGSQAGVTVAELQIGDPSAGFTDRKVLGIRLEVVPPFHPREIMGVAIRPVWAGYRQTNCARTCP